MELLHRRAELEIIDAESGQVYGREEVAERVINSGRFFASLLSARKLASSVVCLRALSRGVDLICTLYGLLSHGIPFEFSDALSREVRQRLGLSLYEYDGKELNLLDPVDGECTFTEQLCCAITTSGTTGARKSVGVLRACIEPNIRDFSDLFSLSSSDIILFSTSLSFDPSIVELFLAADSRATLLFVPDHYRTQPYLLMEAIRKYKPTIAQLTPAVLSLLDSASLTYLLGANSPFRILLIGGDAFPLDIINRHRTEDNRTRIFNVYGVTEVSCWASYYEVAFGCQEVSIGTPIFGTEFIVSEDDQLFLGGSRKCLINGCYLDGPTPTGDLVETVENGLKVVGRVDDQLKINGIRFNPSALCNKLCAISQADLAQLMVIQDTFLVLFVQIAKNIRLDSSIREVFSPLLRPVKIFYLEEMPINQNGKVDRVALRKLALEEENFDGELRLHRILQRYGISMTETNLTKSFVDYEIAFELRRPNAMRDILDPQMSVEKFFEKYGNDDELIDSGAISSNQAEKIDWNFLSIELINKRQPSAVWAYDTGKCIDGDVAVGKNSNGVDVVVVASHSGRISCIQLSTGIVEWEKAIPARIEASVLITQEKFVVVGAYDGVIYIMFLDDGEFFWSFATNNKNSQEIMPIKAACLSQDDFIYAISYTKHALKLNLKQCSCTWKCRISAGSPSQPQLSNDKQLLLCTTINGTVEAINQEDGTLSWLCKLESPIFAPLCLSTNGYWYGTTVGGEIFKIDENGEKLISSKIGSPIFAPIFIDRKSRDSSNQRLICTTQDGALFRLTRELQVEAAFIFPQHSFVRAPVETENGELFLQSTCGHLLQLPASILTSFPLFSTLSPLRAFRIRVSSARVFSRPFAVSLGKNGECLRKEGGVSHSLAPGSGDDAEGGAHDDKHLRRQQGLLLLIGGRDDWLRCLLQQLDNEDTDTS